MKQTTGLIIPFHRYPENETLQLFLWEMQKHYLNLSLFDQVIIGNSNDFFSQKQEKEIKSQHNNITWVNSHNHPHGKHLDLLLYKSTTDYQVIIDMDTIIYDLMIVPEIQADLQYNEYVGFIERDGENIRRFAPYFACLNIQDDVPSMHDDTADPMTGFTDWFIKKGKKYKEITDNRGSIILDNGTITQSDWIDTGIYHLRNISAGIQIIEEYRKDKESAMQRAKAMPQWELLRILLLLIVMSNKTAYRADIIITTAINIIVQELNTPIQQFTEYANNAEKYYKKLIK